MKNLMVWSNEHKAAFKAKVKHIVERMVRKFGVEAVERACPPENRKLITNIRKTREQRKKKKAAAEEEGGAPVQEKRKSKFESEYDQAVYGSESEESEDGDSEDEFVKNQGRKLAGAGGKDKGPKTYIVEDEDEPLDLLSKRALGNISSTKPLRQRRDAAQGTQKLTKAKTDVESGKLIIGDDSDDDMASSKKGRKAAADDDADMLMDIDNNATLEEGINAYVDAIRGKDAAQRGQKGKLKFSNRKRADDDMEVDEEDEKAARKAKSGSGMGAKTQRRGLGAEKQRGVPQGGQQGGHGRVFKNKGGRGGRGGRGGPRGKFRP